MRAFQTGTGLSCATPLTRWDGRPVASMPCRIGERIGGTLRLRYWQAGRRFRDVALAAFSVAVERAEREVVVFLCQPKGAVQLQRGLSEVRPSISLIATSVSRLSSGGSEQLARLIRERHASVVVVDRLERLMPRVHWSSPKSRLEEAEQETLQEIRRLLPVDRPAEAILFHCIRAERAHELLDEGFVDEALEVRL